MISKLWKDEIKNHLKLHRLFFNLENKIDIKVGIQTLYSDSSINNSTFCDASVSIDAILMFIILTLFLILFLHFRGKKNENFGIGDSGSPSFLGTKNLVDEVAV